MEMFQRISEKMREFMYGRYGGDQLGIFLLGIGVALCLVSSFSRLYWLGFIAYVPLIYASFRMYSRNTYKRQQENQRFRLILRPLRDRQHRYYRCPRCRQKIRVPRGKGKILITCPSCKEKFQKKT